MQDKPNKEEFYLSDTSTSNISIVSHGLNRFLSAEASGEKKNKKTKKIQKLRNFWHNEF